MGGIRLVLPEHPAGSQDADGRLGVLHDPDLHGAGLGPQQNGVVIGKVEGIAAVPGRVSLFNIQPGKVVVRQLHLGALYHLVAHAHKGILDLLEHLVHGVLMADVEFLPGNGHVNGLRGQLGLQCGGMDGGFPFLQLFLNGGTDRIGHLAHDRPLLSGELAHLFQNGGELALLAQQLYPQLFQSRRSRRILQGRQGLLANAFQLFFHKFLLLNRKVFMV